MALGHGRPLIPWAFFQPQDYEDAPQSFRAQQTQYEYASRSPWLGGKASLFVAAAALLAVASVTAAPKFVHAAPLQATFQPQPAVSHVLIQQFQAPPLGPTKVTKYQDSRELLQPAIFRQNPAGLLLGKTLLASPSTVPSVPAPVFTVTPNIPESGVPFATILATPQETQRLLQPEFFDPLALFAPVQPTPVPSQYGIGTQALLAASQSGGALWGHRAAHPSQDPLVGLIGIAVPQSPPLLQPILWGSVAVFAPGQPTPVPSQYGYGLALTALQPKPTIFSAILPSVAPTPPPLRPVVTAVPQITDRQLRGRVQVWGHMAAWLDYITFVYGRPPVDPTQRHPIRFSYPHEGFVPTITPVPAFGSMRASAFAQPPAVFTTTLIQQFQAPVLRPTWVAAPQTSREYLQPLLTDVLIQQFQAPPLKPTLTVHGQDDPTQRAANLRAPLQVPPVFAPTFGFLRVASPQTTPIVQGGSMIWFPVVASTTSILTTPRHRPAYHPSYQPGRGRSSPKS